jgi:hypothetical protein
MTEALVDIEAVRVPPYRQSYGSLADLGASIDTEGLQRPVTVWKDGTLISGARRLRAHLLIGRKNIPAVFVDTIEDAAKGLLADSEDTRCAKPMKWTEVCRLWETLRQLDAPAAARRYDAARRLGVELRRQTLAGKRKKGRTARRTEDYVLTVLAPAYGVSEATASRLWTVYRMANDLALPYDRREQAHTALSNIDKGLSSISASYGRLISGRSAPVARPRPAPSIASAEAGRQLAAWSRSLPQMEGLVSGLVELGPPNAELTWEQVGSVHARLAAVRRDLEKMIKQMKERSKS